MNFDDAIAAHLKWKARLDQFIEGTSNESLNSATICKDNLCDLGKWIYGDGAKYQAAPPYADLVKKHAHFHVCAADVVKLVEGGDKPAATSLLSGAFASASAETVAAIKTLREAAASL